MKTYTFIAEFRGGIYCTQLKAASLNHAVLTWIEKLKLQREEIKYLGDQTIQQLEQQVKDNTDQPVPLTGLTNVWYDHFATRQGSFHVTIVQTAKK